MSQNTVASYCSDVEKFLKFYGGRLEDASVADVEEYLQSREGLSERSQARVLSSLRSFFDWLVMEKVLKDNPCDRVDGPKIGRYLPNVLSEEEVAALIDSVEVSGWQGLRDRAILEILYGCGIRVSEAVGLKISCLYFAEGFIRVIGKGNKERIVYFGTKCLELIELYLSKSYNKLNINMNPDTIYRQKSNNNFEVYYDLGSQNLGLYFDDYLAKKDKYAYFLDANHGLIQIKNNDISSNERLLIIKDSYAKGILFYFSYLVVADCPSSQIF